MPFYESHGRQLSIAHRTAIERLRTLSAGAPKVLKLSIPTAQIPRYRSGKEKRSGDLSLLPPRIAEIPRFCLRRKSLHLLSRFSPPEVIRLQLVMPLNPHRGSIIVFATVMCK